MDVFLLSLLASSVLAPSLLEAVHPYYVAVRRMQAGDYGKAVPYLDRAITWQLHLVDSLILRGLALTQLESWDQAMADFDRALRIKPDAALALLGRARLKHARGRPDEALHDYDDALHMNPELTQAYYGRAMARLHLGFSTAAADDVQAWLNRWGWWQPEASFVAIIGYLAHRQAGQAQAARQIVSEARLHLKPDRWPTPLFEYLDGAINSQQLVDRAYTPLEKVHAHTTVGLDLAYAGRRDVALPYLTWVRDNARHVPGDHARELALAELDRLARR